MDKPAVSVLIPTYNRAEVLKRSLFALVAQTYKNFEVIVCDDGSTDQTKEIVELFRNNFILKYIWEENWGGPARPRNCGLKIAQGEYIAFLDSDDWWYPKKLEAVARHFPDMDVVYHDLDVYTPKGREYFRKVKGRRLSLSPFIDLMVNGDALANSGVVIRKRIIDQVGGLSEDRSLIAAEDSDLWLKVARATNRFKYMPISLGAYYQWDGNATEMSDKQILRVRALSERHVSFLESEDRGQHQMLLTYMIAGLKLRMGLLNDAFEFFKISVRARSLKFKVRSVFYMLFIIIKRITGGFFAARS